MMRFGLAALAACVAAMGCATQNVPANKDASSLSKVKVTAKATPKKKAGGYDRPVAPPLTGGVWLNTDKPIDLKSLRGHVVILDFWTYCCINCLHILPELKRVEQRFKGKPVVVIGVHSGKFDAEKDPLRIRQAIDRYDVKHPVVVDSTFTIWRRYQISAWPTLVIIDTDGTVLAASPGEPKRGLLGDVVQVLLDKGKKMGTLAKKPFEIKLPKVANTGPLAFPGKVAVAANGNIAVADSNHHRILVLDKNGKQIASAGSGIQGSVDGDFASAAFNRPQGMVFADGGRTLYVADTENHQLRKLNLKARTVETIAGTGLKAEGLGKGGPAATTALRSPWDLALDGGSLYVAMAGAHQIWKYDLKAKTIKVFAGSGRESIIDGGLAESAFSQPSGLSLARGVLYVADSEVSAIRAIDLKKKKVRTIVGTGLFDFGDIDGVGKKVRFQHALGVVSVNGVLYVADTYNNKIKRLDPRTRRATTFVGAVKGTFDDPGGIAVLPSGKLLIADTNKHRLRILDPRTKKVTTLALTGVTKPAAAGLIMGAGAKKRAAKLRVVKVKARGSLGLGRGFVDFVPQPPVLGKLADKSPIVIDASSVKGGVRFGKKVRAQMNPFTLPVKIPVDVATRSRTAVANLDVTFYWCRKDGTACLPERVRLAVALTIDPAKKGGRATVTHRVGTR